jgi:hypothetical protein
LAGNEYGTLFENRRLDPVKIYSETGDVLTVISPGKDIFIVSQNPRGIYSRWEKITFLPYRKKSWLEFVKPPGWKEPELDSEFVNWFLYAQGDELESLLFEGQIIYFPKGIPVRFPIQNIFDRWILAESVEFICRIQRVRDEEYKK